MAETTQWFLERARSSLRDARMLHAKGGDDANVLFLAHKAQEMALKGALAEEGIWSANKSRLQTHRLGELVAELISSGVAVPDTVTSDVEDTR